LQGPSHVLFPQVKLLIQKCFNNYRCCLRGCGSCDWGGERMCGVFEFLKQPGVGKLQLSQQRKTVVSLLGDPGDTSVRSEPEILKWSNLECAFYNRYLSLISVYFGDGHILLPQALRDVEKEINGALPRFMDVIAGERLFEIVPIEGITFGNQSGFRIGKFWTLVVTGDRPYSLSTMATWKEISEWNTRSE
jgi:hypothetical protein